MHLPSCDVEQFQPTKSEPFAVCILVNMEQCASTGLHIQLSLKILRSDIQYLAIKKPFRSRLVTFSC
jgi:hypothetical protein